MTLRVLIADDEPLSRERLRQFLDAEPRTEVVAECASGSEALNAIKQTHPDLVFLDVKMPELDGFGVLAALNGTRMPAIIFVTAYDQFAVRAFEVQAVDYLLKPFGRERFQTAFRRARARLQSEPAPSKDAVRLTALAGPIKPLERVAVKSNGRISLINIEEIDWVCAADNYTQLHVGKSSHFLRMTITALGEQLLPNRFVRISRSHLVNLERIKEIHPKSHGDYTVILKDGTSLPASRLYRRNLVDLLSNAR